MFKIISIHPFNFFLKLLITKFEQSHLIDIEGRQTNEILRSLLSFRSVIEAGRTKDEVELLPRLFVVGLQPDEPVDLRGSNPTRCEVFFDQLLPRVVLHRVTPLRRARAQQVKRGPSKNVEFLWTFDKPVKKLFSFSINHIPTMKAT